LASEDFIQGTGFFQIGTTRFISSINHWHAANASPRCGATTSTHSDGSLTFTTPMRWTRRTDFAEGFVFDGGDRFAVLFTAHRANEMKSGAHAGGHLPIREECGFVDRIPGDGELAVQFVNRES
jgi:hypothetical protein